MRVILKISLLIALLAGMVACKKSKDFTEDESTPTGIGYTPVSANSLQDVTVNPLITLGTTSGSASLYTAGSSFKTELTFFSQSPIKETTLSATVGAGTKTLVTTIPYSPAYSKNKSLDTLLVPYTLPTVAVGTVIKLEYQITNVNTLNIIRTVYVKVK
jgi:hypothetical protein